MNNIGSFFLSVLVSYGRFISLLVHPKAPSDSGEFTPVIRFLATSDGHITTIGDVQTTRLEKMIKMGNKIAQSDKEYRKLDAVLVAGDITDMGTRIAYGSIKAALAPVLKKDTQFLATVSTSHDDRKLGKASLELYRNIMGQETDFHRVINGFHFVGVSASETLKENYDDKQKSWLREQLDAAVADDPSKPVFVFQHEHIKDTVYGSYESEGWGMPDLADVMKEYPQVVNFSGHSHYPINDARSIWQGDYTALGTGGLYYAELTVDDIKTVHPKRYRSVSTFWVVEVDKNNRIRLRAADLKSQQYLCEYILDGPLSREYTPAKQLARSLPPVFGKESRVKKGKDCVTFDAAESADGMPVFIYRAFAVSASGERIPAGKTVAPYYLYKAPAKVKIKLEKLPADTQKIEIVAENCYGIQSAPASVSLCT